MHNLKVHKKKLQNGLNVLVAPKFQIPKTSVQLWYNVGSKHEIESERGIAHLIEHMVFKGTKNLSESDIGLIVNKLSGSCNAFTSYDYTCYLFDLPSHQWEASLSILADCMNNCTFKEDLLNSELKTVIQELKMYNDNYLSVLLEKLISAIFEDHPYHHPVIGYKKDLWSLQRDRLVKFYQKYYSPNNANLVIVGAVDPENAFKQAELYFNQIPEKKEPILELENYHARDIVQKSITVYREINQPHVVLAWEVPGLKTKNDYLLDVISWMIGSGKSSLLSKLLVDEHKLVNYVESFVYDLVEHGLFIIYFQPKIESDISKIIEFIFKEIEKVGEKDFSKNDLERAYRKAHMDFISTIESQEKCAYFIGKHFTAHQDENYLSKYFNISEENLPEKMSEFVQTFLRRTVAHTGVVVPIPEQEKKFWIKQQELADEEDQKIVSRIKRESLTIEPPLFANNIEARPQPNFKFPKAKSFTLNNGLKVLYYHSPFVPKIDVILKFKACWHNEPDNQQGVLNFLMEMLQEGTQKYPGNSFMEILESYGITLNTAPGQISMSMLSEDSFEGFSLLVEMLTNAKIPQTSIEKIRSQILSDLTDFWDTPIQFVGQLARDLIYEKHPYRKHYLGNIESVKSITHQMLQKTYQKFITPQDSTLVLVGDLEAILNEHDIEEYISSIFGLWQGPKIEDLNFELPEPKKSTTVYHKINRDQTILAFAGLSIERTNKDFDKLLLFDQVLTGNALGVMCSRLFQIREQTGIFYSIEGSILAGAHHQPGMIFIKTMISPDQVALAEELIISTLKKGAEDLTTEELENAKRALESALIDNFSDNRSIASALLFLEQFKFSEYFFDNRAQQLSQISLEQVKEAVKSHINTEYISKIYVGRMKTE